MLGSHRMPFQAIAVVSEEVYITMELVAIFHNVNVLVKARNLLFSKICHKLKETLQLLFNLFHPIPHTGSFSGSFYLLTSVIAKRTIQFCSVLRQTFDHL